MHKLSERTKGLTNYFRLIRLIRIGENRRLFAVCALVGFLWLLVVSSAQAVALTMKTVPMNLATDGVLDIANNGQDRYKSITAELNFGSTNLAAVGDMLVLEILFSEGPFNKFSITDLGDTPFERLDFVQFHSPGNTSLGVVGTVIGSVEVEFLDVVGIIDNLARPTIAK